MVQDLVADYGVQILTVLAALVIAAMVFLFSEPAARREPEAAGENDELARMAQAESERAELESVDRRGPRYLEFYRALETSPQQPDPTPAAVDLVREEALEEGAKSEPRPAAAQERPSWPRRPAGEAKATRLSR
jgi:flagellar biosynthesis/type III secretory pathway M-ring protein FliF/YscJ